MKQEQQRIAIAEACGWSIMSKSALGVSRTPTGYPPGDTKRIIRVPDYLNDLNAMHEAWSTLSRHQKIEATDYLIDAVKATREYLKIDAPPNLAWSQRVSSIADILDAAESQYAEAFLKTLHLWTE